MSSLACAARKLHSAARLPPIAHQSAAAGLLAWRDSQCQHRSHPGPVHRQIGAGSLSPSLPLGQSASHTPSHQDTSSLSHVCVSFPWPEQALKLCVQLDDWTQMTLVSTNLTALPAFGSSHPHQDPPPLSPQDPRTPRLIDSLH